MHARTISHRCTGVMCTGVFRCSSVMTPSLFAKSDSKKRLAIATLTAPLAPPIRKNQPEDSVTQPVYLSAILRVLARTIFEHECLQNGVLGIYGRGTLCVTKARNRDFLAVRGSKYSGFLCQLQEFWRFVFFFPEFCCVRRKMWRWIQSFRRLRRRIMAG